MIDNSPRSWVSKNYRSFNGLRGAAVLMVFADHYLAIVVPFRYVDYLWTGVDLFFALSGFLITGILVDSVRSPRYFRDFYTRRALRIFPLYYGFYLLVFALTPVLHLHYDSTFWTNLLYLMNYTTRHPDVHNNTVFKIGNLNPLITLGSQWSLCVEEHFYLLWPLIVWLLRDRRRTLMYTCIGGVLATLTLRIALYLHNPPTPAAPNFLYMSTFTRCDTLLLGALLAVCLRLYRIPPRRFHTIAWGLIAIGLGAIGIGLSLTPTRLPWDGDHPVFCTYGYTFVGLVAVGIVMLAVDEASWLSRLLRNRQLQSLGVISYGFYFLHLMPAQFVGRLANHARPFHLQGLVVLGAFAASYAAASYSYRYFESPFLRLKDYVAPPIAHSSKPAGIAVSSPPPERSGVTTPLLS